MKYISILKLIFEGKKIISSQGRDIIRNGYLSGGLFVLNIVQYFINNSSISNSAFNVKSINLCYGRVGHVSIFLSKDLEK